MNCEIIAMHSAEKDRLLNLGPARFLTESVNVGTQHYKPRQNILAPIACRLNGPFQYTLQVEDMAILYLTVGKKIISICVCTGDNKSTVEPLNHLVFQSRVATRMII